MQFKLLFSFLLSLSFFGHPLRTAVEFPTNIASVNLVISYNKFFFPLF